MNDKRTTFPFNLKLSKMELSGSESDGRFTVAFLGPLGTYTHEVSKVSMSLSLEANGAAGRIQKVC